MFDGIALRACLVVQNGGKLHLSALWKACMRWRWFIMRCMNKGAGSEEVDDDVACLRI